MADPLREVATAFIWLTRLPIRQSRLSALSQCVWAFPLVGLAVGLIGAVVLLLADGLALPPAAGALLALGAMALVTGALHEDGLADFADGLGGQSREHALDIMRDSRIGSYGVLALILVIGLKVAALAALEPAQAAMALIGAAAASRAGMAAGMRLPAARRDGLGHAAGRPDASRVTLAIALAAAVLFWTGGVVALIACATVQFLIAQNARRRLGGQTGDVLGAMQQAGEVATLLAIGAML